MPVDWSLSENSMSFKQLALRFAELEKELGRAVRDNNGERIRQLDVEIEDCFSELLAMEPESKPERLEQCSFFIERLRPSSDRHGIEETICQKILDIVASS